MTIQTLLIILAVPLVGLAVLSGAAAQTKTPAASEIVARIKAKVGVPWTEPTVDTFKEGDPATQVTGIAVTMMPTLEVLQQAARTGKNLIIAHEPLYYGHLDDTTQLETEKDPVFLKKRKFIREHGLIIWRFHDYWHRRNPDGIHEGVVRALGWKKYQDPVNPAVFTLPVSTLNDLAGRIKKDLGIHVLRVVGAPDVTVSKVGISEGFWGFDGNRRIFASDGVEVLVVGEAHEWETIAYGTDAIRQGEKKGLIILGHIPSEQAGMEQCARWLRGFVNEVPVEFIPSEEPFWTPR
jgi:putative NIF3 family GTP cyclohydrolase 1 type 2